MKMRTRRARGWTAHPKRRTPPGAPPGIIAVDPLAHKPQIEVFAYGPDQVEQLSIPDPSQLSTLLGKFPVLWVNVEGLGDADVLQTIGDLFGLHPLAMEDVVNLHQRPKIEEYGDHLFIVTHMVSYLEDRLDSEQLCLFLGQNFVITFQEEKPGDCLKAVRQRLLGGRKAIRGANADFLAYSILDAVADHYFPVLERYGERLQEYESAAMSESDHRIMAGIQDMKMDLLSLRRLLWPLRDLLNTLLRDDFPAIQKETQVYLRDCYDHSIQALDLIEMYREAAASVMELYLSNLNHQMSQVMKVLTTIATIFIPITFVAGVYGMNFNPQSSPLNMPELNWAWGYPFALLIMATIVVIMLLFFRRKKWL
ncbi:MAG: magnesium/cobalt transporter CorA [Bradymonadales bacterium]|nr:magnesium/cobalt transporter CorA [Bradymonadales bacterium]